VFEFGVTGIGAKLISLEKNIEKRMIKSLNILGSGNVAHFFLDRFFNKIEIKSIYCHSKSLDFSGFDSLQNKVVNDISELKEADLNIICVNDSAIEDVAKKISSEYAVVHTSGSVSLNTLQKFKKSGVLYPLQSISKNRLSYIEEAPILLEANTSEFEKELCDFTKEFLYKTPIQASSEHRKKIHLAAVIANNFSNYLLFKAKSELEDAGAEFALIYPLMKETLEKAFQNGPEFSQTGPAKRNDLKVIDGQLELIKDVEFKKLYLQFSKLIQRDFNS
jgi:predicted short-subunit dehydrogenase-like oxidoreductase (DUF2520 family)